LEVLTEIAQAREATLARMKAAFQANDAQTVLECAARLCGFEEEKAREYAALAGSQAAQSNSYYRARAAHLRRAELCSFL
jgi:hypothetical protein